MRVKMRSTLAGPHGTALPGETIDLPPDVAQGLVDGGYAVAVDLPLPLTQLGSEETLEGEDELIQAIASGPAAVAEGGDVASAQGNETAASEGGSPKPSTTTPARPRRKKPDAPKAS